MRNFRKLILCALLATGYIGNSWGALELTTKIEIAGEEKSVIDFFNDIYSKLNEWAQSNSDWKKDNGGKGKNLISNKLTFEFLKKNSTEAQKTINDVRASEILKYEGVAQLLKKMENSSKKLNSKGIEIKTFITILRTIKAIDDNCECILGGDTKDKEEATRVTATVKRGASTGATTTPPDPKKLSVTPSSAPAKTERSKADKARAFLQKR